MLPTLKPRIINGTAVSGKVYKVTVQTHHHFHVRESSLGDRMSRTLRMTVMPDNPGNRRPANPRSQKIVHTHVQKKTKIAMVILDTRSPKKRAMVRRPLEHRKLAISSPGQLSELTIGSVPALASLLVIDNVRNGTVYLRARYLPCTITGLILQVLDLHRSKNDTADDRRPSNPLLTDATLISAPNGDFQGSAVEHAVGDRDNQVTD